MREFRLIPFSLATGFLVLLFLCGQTRALVAKEILDGPVQAIIARVIDGDTLEVLAHVWLGQEVRIAVRIAGIDAPEMRGKCSEERALAKAALDFLKRFEGAQVSLTRITNGKFAGRVLADVFHGEEGDLGQALREAGMARVYDGGQRGDWCAQLIARGATTLIAPEAATPGQ